MSKEKLGEELFRHLEEKEPKYAERARIEALQRSAEQAARRQLPASAWQSIEQSLAEPRLGFAGFLRLFSENPRLAAFAVLVAGILVGAFFLLNTATPSTLQLIELTQDKTLQSGQKILARGVQIEALESAVISRQAGDTEKIILRSGSFSVALKHAELTRPLRFIFPGGSLEPLGTAFTLKITEQGSAVNLTEGKLRVMRFDPKAKEWQSSEVVSPYSSSFSPRPVEEVPDSVPALQDELPSVKKRRSRFSASVGKNITLELKNGDRLTGILRAAGGDRLRLATSSGELTIPEAQVVRVQPK